MYIIIAILIFGFLIVTHELGHFGAAKLFNVRVSEFSVGMGPAIITKQRGETLYAWRWIPFGGYCAMDEDAGESEDERAFVNQSAWKRFVILFAGAFMNFVTGLIILLFIVESSPFFMTPTITDFFDNCPYESVDGLQEGDTFLEIDGDKVYFSSDVGMLLAHEGGEIHDVLIERNGEEILLDNYKLTLVEYEVDGETVERYGIYFGVKEEGVGAILEYTWYGAMDFVRMVWMGLGDLVTGAVGLKDMAGPVGIVGLMNDVGEASPTTSAAVLSIAYLAAFIAINLAVMNLLPLPALDGGRLFFLVVTAIIEKITRKKLNPKYEGYVHTAGFVLLLGLMVVVMASDIYKLFV